MIKYKIPILVVVTLIIFSTVSIARILIPPITGPITKKISVFVPDLTSVGDSRDEKALEFVDVLRNDLLNAGLFDAGAEALVMGEYQSSGDMITIAMRLFDVVQERELLGRSYEAPAGTVRW